MKQNVQPIAASAQYMADRIGKELTGRRIMGPVVSTDGEFFGFKLDNDLTVWVLRDEEGNGPGFLDME